MGFLLDSHVPIAVVAAVQRLVPSCTVIHLSSWNNGILLHAPDERILLAALADELALVTFDAHTIPAILHRWSAAGRLLPGVVLLIPRSVQQRDVGSIGRGLAELCTHPDAFDPAYPVVYLHPASW